MGHSISKDAKLVLKAARNGDTQLVRSYLEEDPSRIKSVTFMKRFSILHMAAKHDLPELILTCLDPHVEAVRDEIRTGMYPGAACRRLRKIVNARDIFNRTPLLVAAKDGHVRCVRRLAENAANLFAIDRDANTALHLACLHERQEVVDYLITKTRSRGILDRLVNKRNMCGFSALHYAVWRGHIGIVHALLCADADISFCNDRVFDPYVPVPVGSTPLHLAVMRSNMEVIMVLLEHQALREIEHTGNEPPLMDPRAQENLYGLTPSGLAAQLRNHQLASLLHPGQPAASLFSEEELATLRRHNQALPSLQTLACQALQQLLQASLDAAVAPAPSTASASLSPATSGNAAAQFTSTSSEQVQAEADGAAAGCGRRDLQPSKLPASGSELSQSSLRVAFNDSLRWVAQRRPVTRVSVCIGALTSGKRSGVTGAEMSPGVTSSSDTHLDDMAASGSSFFVRHGGQQQPQHLASEPSSATLRRNSTGTYSAASSSSSSSGEWPPFQSTTMAATSSAAITAAAATAAQPVATLQQLLADDMQVVCSSGSWMLGETPGSPCGHASSEQAHVCFPQAEAGDSSCTSAGPAAGATGEEAAAAAHMQHLEQQDGSGHPCEVEEGEPEACGVCLDAAVNIQMDPCQHPLCAGCAERVISMHNARPPACPFCRSHIRGFQRRAPVLLWI